MYTFKVVDNIDPRIMWSGNIENPWSRHQAEPGFRLGKYMARFRGSVQALFGAPPEVASISDEAFSYVIEASDEQGKTWILSVYQGSSGSAIGGHREKEGINDVVEALIALIESTLPADYEAVVYDGDTDWTVRYGCISGSCFYEERKGDHRKEKW